MARRRQHRRRHRHHYHGLVRYAAATSSANDNWTFSPAIFQQQLKHKSTLPRMSALIKPKFARPYFPYPNYA